VNIKTIPGETTLLVIEKAGYEHYHAKGVVVTAGMLSSASRSSYSENGRDEHHHKEGSTSSHKDADDANLDYEDVADEIANIAESVEKEEAAKFEEEKKPDKANLSLNVTATKVSTSSSSSPPIESPKSPVVIGGIEFAGTAEEARKKMSKKRNVKETSMSLKAKYDLFQKL